MDFGTIFAALVIGHYLADFWVQTDHQAAHKGLTGPESWCGRWNAAKHATTYTATLFGVVAGVLSATGADWDASTVLWLVVGNGVTHYVIDRRWTLEALACKLGKSGWIARDRAGAMMHLDQAAHLVLFGPVALGIHALA